MTINPDQDGYDHINVYSKGRTVIGVALSNFTRAPFTCSDGRFASVEGYWYWLSVPKDEPKRDLLKSAYGFQAKKLGRDLRGDDWTSTDEFKAKILEALDAKIEQNPQLKEVFMESTLPFKHYYVFESTKGGLPGIYEEKSGQWMLDFFEQKRSDLKYNAGVAQR